MTGPLITLARSSNTCALPLCRIQSSSSLSTSSHTHAPLGLQRTWRWTSHRARYCQTMVRRTHWGTGWILWCVAVAILLHRPPCGDLNALRTDYDNGKCARAHAHRP
jgi:hypothetical protein